MAAPNGRSFDIQVAIQETEEEANVKSAEFFSLETVPQTAEILRQKDKTAQELELLRAQLRRLRALAGQAGEQHLFFFLSHPLQETLPFPCRFLSQDLPKPNPNPTVAAKPPPDQLGVVNTSATSHDLRIGQLTWGYNLTNA